MNNSMENSEGLFLGFAFCSPYNANQLFKDRVRQGSNNGGRENRPLRAKVRNAGEGALDAFANVRRHDLQVVVPKAIKGTEQASNNGRGVPACFGIFVGARFGDTKVVKGRKEFGPAFFPPTQSDPGGPEHSGEVDRKDRTA